MLRMFDLNDLTKQLVQNIGAANDAKISKATEDTIKEVRETVVAEAVKESLSIDNIENLTTDEELNAKLADYVKTADIFKSGYFSTKYSHSNGSYAQLWNETDGGGSQYYNSSADIISYVGTNDGDENGICVQIYSKSKDGLHYTETEVDGITEISGLAKNSGVRINVNPHGAYYTKGTNTSATGGSVYNEIATKGDVKKVSDTINNKVSGINELKSKVSKLETLVAQLQAALANATDASGNSVYTIPVEEPTPVDDEL